MIHYLGNVMLKQKQSRRSTKKRNVREHNIQVGDEVLILQKTTKSKSWYDPDPYTVTKVQGSQITATRGEKVRVRDAQKFKKVVLQQKRNYRSQRQHPRSQEEEEVDLLSPLGRGPTTTTTTLPQPPAANPTQAASTINRYPNGYLVVDPTLSSQRRRQKPDRFVPT